jgi:hypothetical protein
LELSGSQCAGNWFTDLENEIRHENEETLFTSKSTQRIRDALVLPGFQCHLGQHPGWEVDVVEADCD